MNVFKTGDVVVLKSGGPDMTVTSYQTDPTNPGLKVFCMWFQPGDCKFEKALFEEAALKASHL